jgi:hypothetical protein
MTAITNRSLETIAKEILKHERNAVASVIAIGGLLVEAETQCEHGEYMPWLTANFQWSHQTSLRYRRLFELTQNQHSVDFEALNISLSALYFVADCPKGIDPFGLAFDGAMAAIIEAAKTQRVSLSVAQSIFRETIRLPKPADDQPQIIDPDAIEIGRHCREGREIYDSVINADDEEGDEEVTGMVIDLGDAMPLHTLITVADDGSDTDCPPLKYTHQTKAGEHTDYLPASPLHFLSALHAMLATHTKASDDQWLEQIEDNPVEFYKLLDHMIDLRAKREAANSPMKMKADRAEAKAKNGR